MLGYALALVPVILLLCGAIWYFVFHRNAVSVPYLGVAALVAVLLSAGLVPSSYAVTKSIATSASVGGFKEYWNGWELSAERRDIACYRDGMCRHTYQCDPYTKMVSVTKYRTVSDGNGGTKQQSYQAQEPKTFYRQCPYSKQETDYTIKTTLGSITVADNLMTGEPFRLLRPIPGGQQSDPARWVEAKKRTDANKPNSVTTVNSYDNFLLGSQDAAFSRNESNVERLLADGLLPKLATGVYDLYNADKVYRVKDAGDGRYVKDVANLNGAFGTDLQGDLHVVFVPSDIPVSQTDYAEALMAYWQSAEMSKGALSKNAVVVILGVDDKEVMWAEARTGMPVGNEGLVSEIRHEMPGKPLDARLIGSPTFDIPTETVKRSEGALEGILWGENGYERVSMSGDDEDDNGMGFQYLRDSIQPPTWGLVLAGGVASLIAGGLMLLAMHLMSMHNFMTRPRSNR